MKRQVLILLALAGALVCLPTTSAFAAGRGGRGIGHGGGIPRSFSGSFNRGFGGGFGFGGFGGFGGWGDCGGYDIAELYRQLYNNLPFFALHPPVYYSYPVPRTYGYSPFAYPPGVMTPDVSCEVQPLTITNPYVPTSKPATTSLTPDKTAETERTIEPLVIINPFAPQSHAVAADER